MWLPDLPALYDLTASAASCSDANVSYYHRVQDKDHYNYCVVPESGSDAILFISIAILAACICSGSLSALYVLMLGKYITCILLTYLSRDAVQHGAAI